MLVELALGRVGLRKGDPRPGGELSQSLVCATSQGEKAGVPVLGMEEQSRIRQAPMGVRALTVRVRAVTDARTGE